MRVENEESKSGTGRIFAEAYKHIKPVWHSKEFGRSTPSHGRSPSRDEPEQPAAGAQDALDGATTHAEGQGLIPPGLCAGPEPHVPGAFGDLREGRPGTEARETPRLPLQHDGAHASHGRSTADPSRSQRRSAPPATPRSSTTVSDTFGDDLPLYHTELARAHQTIAQLEAEKRELQAAVEGLIRERDDQAARRLVVSAFDSTLDRVSEGELRRQVDALNGTIDDFVMDLIESAKAVPHAPGAAGPPAFGKQHGALMRAAQALAPDDDRRELLLDAYLHGKIVRRLFSAFFSSTASIRTEAADMLSDLHSRVAAADDWKVTQRWRAVTSTAVSTYITSGQLTYDKVVSNLTNEIMDLLPPSLCRPADPLQPLQGVVTAGVQRLFKDAFALANTSRQDLVSAEMSLVTASCSAALDPAAVEVQWPEMGARSSDAICGIYAFGLRKRTEKGEDTLLIRPKVITDSLLRYAAREGDAAE